MRTPLNASRMLDRSGSSLGLGWTGLPLHLPSAREAERFCPMRKFKVFTVGWEPAFVQYLLTPIAGRTGIEFTHGIVGDSRRIPIIRQQFPHYTWVALS